MADAKITELTELSTPALEDVLVVVDDPSGTPVTKKMPLSNLILDEDDMASDSDTALATQQSIKAYVDNNPYGGWLTTGISGVTVTRESTDNPTVVLRFDADVRDYIWKGMRIKATENSIVHYFIVSADPTDDSGDTLVTCLSEIDTSTPTQAKNLIGATTISDVAYAPPKTYPKGFPIGLESWVISRSISGGAQYTSTSVGEITANLRLTVPPGEWSIILNGGSGVNANGKTEDLEGQIGLSTSNNSFSDTSLITYFRKTGSAASSNHRYYMNVYSSKHYSLDTKTIFYMVAQSIAANSRVWVATGSTNFVVQAVSTLL